MSRYFKYKLASSGGRGDARQN